MFLEGLTWRESKITKGMRVRMARSTRDVTEPSNSPAVGPKTNYARGMRMMRLSYIVQVNQGCEVHWQEQLNEETKEEVIDCHSMKPGVGPLRSVHIYEWVVEQGRTYKVEHLLRPLRSNSSNITPMLMKG